MIIAIKLLPFFKQYRGIILMAVALLVILIAGLAVRSSLLAKKRSEESEMVMRSVMDTLQVNTYFRDDFKRRSLHHDFIQFYRERDFQLAWSTLRKPLPLADSLLSALQRASSEGLEPEDYNSTELRHMRDSVFKRTLLKTNYKRPDLLKLVQLDFQLTAAYLTYASHLKVGRIDPTRLDTNWVVGPESMSLARNLEKTVRSKRVYKALQELLPKHQRYAELKNQLAIYRQIRQRGGWPTISESKFYQPGKKTWR